MLRLHRLPIPFHLLLMPDLPLHLVPPDQPIPTTPTLMVLINALNTPHHQVPTILLDRLILELAAPALPAHVRDVDGRGDDDLSLLLRLLNWVLKDVLVKDLPVASIGEILSTCQ
jgi:hypothetical protein